MPGLLDRFERHLSSTMRGLLDSPKGYGNWPTAGGLVGMMGGDSKPLSDEEWGNVAARSLDFVAPMGGILGGAKGAARLGVAPGEGWKWERGRFEIEDTGALWDGSRDYLKDVDLLGNRLTHPDLYRAYPDLENLPIKINNDLMWKHKGKLHLRDGKPSMIEIRAGLDDPKEVVLHELQHWVQMKEGFPGGGAPDLANTDQMRAVREYLDIPGEREARNVAFRLGMTPGELRGMSPSQSEALMRELERMKYPDLYPE